MMSSDGRWLSWLMEISWRSGRFIWAFMGFHGNAWGSAVNVHANATVAPWAFMAPPWVFMAPTAMVLRMP